MGAELLVFCAYEPMDKATIEKWKDEAPVEMSWRYSPSTVAEESVGKGRTAAEEIGATNIKGLIAQGEAGEALIRTADQEDVDLIVVGNRGMAGATRFLLGSVPNKVSHHAPCDVLIVHTVG
jgi:nucleotide-binding universal stress UspA family protein